MPTVHEFLRSHKADVIREWTGRIGRTLTPEALRRTELEDHIPVFLDELADTLERGFGRSSVPRIPDASPPAAAHGLHRLRLGFDLRELVEEYGALWDAIHAVARAQGVPLDERAADTIGRSIVLGIGEAVSEYTRQKDAEVQRNAAEHFAFIAHELRNPLSSARTSLWLLERRGDASSERLTRLLARSLDRMHTLIQHELEMSRFGAVAVRLEPMSLAPLLEEVTEESAAEAQAKGVEIHTEVAPGLDLRGDARLLRSVLGNLVRNAVKFSHEGGGVTIRARLEAGGVQIEVEDSCGGLPPGKVEAAFTPFVQIGEDRSGFGLGLAIAKQAAEAHEGTIRVRDLPGKGCIFVLELPRLGPR